jgi:hypothetical protein
MPFPILYDSSFYFNTNSKILGYQWEPEYSETELLGMNQEQLQDGINDQRSDELTMEFCTCQNCVIHFVLPTQDECKCWFLNILVPTDILRFYYLY